MPEVAPVPSTDAPTGAAVQPAPGGEAKIQRTFFPIKEITPYHRSWTIKARVTAKSQVREFNRMSKGGSGGKGGAGQGQVFSIDLVDKDGGEIRASFFNDAVPKFGKIIEQGKVYIFSKGGVKVSNKAYSQVNHEYELTFEPNSTITPTEDDGEISTQTK